MALFNQQYSISSILEKSPLGIDPNIWLILNELNEFESGARQLCDVVIGDES